MSWTTFPASFKPTALGELPAHFHEITPNTTGDLVRKIFEAQTNLAGILVMEKARCTGVISRQKFFEILGRPFGVEIFLQRPAYTLMTAMDMSAYILPAHLSIDAGVRAALSRPLAQMYEPLVIEFSDGRVQLLDLHTLLLTQAHLMENVNHTMQVLYEKQRQTSEHLTEVSRLKTQFLAKTSHELQTPLNSIIGFSRAILDGRDGPISKIQVTNIELIQQNAQYLLGLINNILDLSQIDADKMELQVENVDLNQLIKATLGTAQDLIQNKPIEITTDIMSGLLPVIEADHTRVRQILLNLVSNACKFTEAGKISLTADYDDHSVSLSISDTGCGISSDNLKNIFQPFAQAEFATAQSSRNPGLGLSITKHLVEMHSGQIWVASIPNQGSTFRITLPRRVLRSGTTLNKERPNLFLSKRVSSF